MTKTERFEMRLDERTAYAIDAWRDANMAGTSRAHAVRVLIERGLSSTVSSHLRFSDGEKTLMALMGNLFRHLGAPVEQINVMLNGFITGNQWVADLEMGSLYTLPSTSSDEAELVQFALKTLEMWDVFERAYEGFTDEQRAVVLADTEGEVALREVGKQPESREVKFSGFDATSEPDLVRITKFLVNDTPRFQRFKERNLVSNQENTYRYNADKLEFYDRLRPSLIGRLPSPDEVRGFTIARSRISFDEWDVLRIKRATVSS
ncbi:MAG: hypothetical protein I8H91_10150 [Burkholderiales bacterium]|nr:hypothetical protein [Burkholderiales bacterium]